MGGVVRVLDGRSVVEQPRSTSFPLAGRSRLPPPYGYGSTTVIRPSTVPALGCRDTMASRKHHGVDAGGDDDLGICRRVVGTHHPGAVVVRQRDAQGRSRNHQRRAVSHGEAPDLFRSSTISGGDCCTTRNGGGSSGRRGDWDRFVRQGPRRGTFPAKRARKRAVRRLRPPRSDARAFKVPGLEGGNHARVRLQNSDFRVQIQFRINSAIQSQQSEISLSLEVFLCEGDLAGGKVIHAGSHANFPGFDTVANHRGGRAKQFGLNVRVDLDGSHDVAM